MEPLSSEDLQELQSTVPNFEGSYALQRLASKKLLPQQNDVESFEQPSFPTQLRRMFFGHTKKENQLIKRQREELAVLGQEQEALAKFNAHQQFLESIAPSYQQAGQQLPGFQRLAPFQTTEQPASTLIPANEKGFQDMGLLPGTLNPSELPLRQTVGFVKQPGTQVPIPLREQDAYPNTLVPVQEQNPAARLSPAHARLYSELTGQPSVIEPETGALVPLPLARPRLDLMSPEEYKFGLKQLETSGALPEGQTAATMPVPTRPIPRTEATQYFNNLMTFQRLTETDRTNVNRFANAYYGKNFKELQAGGPEQQDVMQKWAAAQPNAYQAALLASPPRAQEQANLYDRKAFVERGELIPRMATSEREARSKETLFIDPRNMDQLNAVEQAISAMDQIIEMGSQVVKATTPFQASMEAARFMANSNPYTRAVPGVYDAQMAAYADQLEAMSNTLSRAFGGERGVLTNVDVQRWVKALFKPGDTIEMKDIKQKALQTLADAAWIAQRRAIAGDDGDLKQIRKDLHNKLNTILSPVEKRASSTSALPEKLTPDEQAELERLRKKYGR